LRAEGPRPFGRWGWLLLVVILGVAGFLRFERPGVVEYRRDEANLSRLALQMARGERVPLLGIGSSIGVPNPPFSVWVFAPPYLAGNDPVLATQYVALLGVLAVLLTFLVGRAWFGTLAGLLAAALFASGPWPVIFARKIWAQDVIPFFVLLTLGCGVLGFLRDRPWARLLFLPLLSITGQIYYGTFVLIPAAVLLLWYGRRSLDRAFWIGAGLAVLSVVPFVMGAVEAWNALPPGVAEAHLAAHEEGRSLALSPDVLGVMRDVFGGSGAAAFVGGRAEARLPWSGGGLEMLQRGVGYFALLAMAWVLWLGLRRRAARLERVLAMWIVATPLVYAVSWTPLKVHYMIPILPAGFLAVGVLLRDVGAVARRTFSGRRDLWAVGAVLSTIVLLQVASQIARLDHVAEHATPGGFGVPLERRLAVRDDILARRAGPVYVVGAGADVVEDGEAAIWDVLLSGAREVRFGEPPANAPAGVTLRYECVGAGTLHAMRPDDVAGRPEACYRVEER